MLSLHPAFQGLVAIAVFVTVALGLWIAFTRWGSRRSAAPGSLSESLGTTSAEGHASEGIQRGAALRSAYRGGSSDA